MGRIFAATSNPASVGKLTLPAWAENLEFLRVISLGRGFRCRRLNELRVSDHPNLFLTLALLSLIGNSDRRILRIFSLSLHLQFAAPKNSLKVVGNE
jgi:hypothetical protein